MDCEQKMALAFPPTSGPPLLALVLAVLALVLVDAALGFKNKIRKIAFPAKIQCEC